MRVRPYFRWFDLWIGIYVNSDPSHGYLIDGEYRGSRVAVYVHLLPMIGLLIDVLEQPVTSTPARP